MGNQNVKRAIWVGAVVIVLMVVVIVFHGIYGQKGSDGTSGNGTQADEMVSALSESPTRTVAPTNVIAPSEGQATTTVAPSVAVPTVQVAAAPGSNASFRSFTINVLDGAYSPSTIIVNYGDTVNLEITAVDGKYGFTQPDYGFNVAIPKGKTQTIGFQAIQSGKFTFYCSACGGPAKGPVGYIIVTAK